MHRYIPMIYLKTFLKICLITNLALSCSSKKKEDLSIIKSGDPVSSTPPVVDPAAPVVPVPVVVPKEVKTVIKNELLHYPELTTLLAVKDVYPVKQKVLEAGGTIVYDPNRGKGTAIGFLIVNLPPEKILDDKFITSLDLKAIGFDQEKLSQITIQGSTPKELSYLSVPIQEIGLNDLRAQYPNQGLGKDVVVAVIDSGIDASHPAFQDRVIYWQDLTREGDLFLKEANVINANEIQVSEKQKLKLPKIFKDGEKIYIGKIDERALAAQVSDQERTASATAGLDINRNDLTNDVFYFVVGQEKQSGKYVAVVDVNRTFDLSGEQGATPIVDFNDYRSEDLKNGFTPFVIFPSTSKTIKYPLVFHFNSDGTPNKITLAADFVAHGTHVAGIIGANGVGIQGAAPEAKFMALKVCSGITCTDQAILRGLVEAFYNPKGIIPDVVNISLGSKQGYVTDIYSFLIRDLAAKFGATFFISASNSGPGLRTINSLGHFGPIVSVGAHVSRKSLIEHYDVSSEADVPENGMFGFSSAGPNFTGQLRPNLVAPGSALSSIPMIEGGADMFNGTSMSSPLAAGGAAALISVIKNETLNNEKLKKVMELKSMKSKDARESLESLKGFSLIDIPLSLRTSLEDSGITIPFQSVLRQGYGLIQIPKALEKFRTYMEKFSEGAIGFTDFRINQNSGAAADRLYDRSVDIADRKVVQLEIEEDGERDQSFMIEHFKLTPMTLKLSRVEVESSDGTVETLKADFPFSIAVPGVEGQNANVRELLLGSGLKNAFISVRNFNRMEAGKTYIAVYELFQNGNRILTLTDLVQRPIEISNALANHSVPSIAPEVIRVAAAYSIKEKEIFPNRNQRLPIAVRSGDQSLVVSANIAEGETGSILVNVYDADGNKVGESTARRSPQSPLNTGPVKLVVPTSGKTGIYEVIVSTSSGRWMGKTKYDLLIKASRFQADKKVLLLKTQLSAIDKISSGDVISVLNTALQAQSVSVKQESFVLVESLNPFPVSVGKWSFKKIPLPKLTGGTSNTQVLVENRGGDNLNCITRIDNNLYKYDAEREGYKVAYTTTTANAKGDKLFKSVNLSDEVYAAVETFTCSIPQVTSGISKGINIEASFPGFPLPVGSTSFSTAVKNANAVENNRFLVSIIAPQMLVLPEDELVPRLRARSIFSILSGDADLKETVEVNLVQ